VWITSAALAVSWLDSPFMNTYDDALLHPTVSNAERGDVPGWVLITLMTAGLVVVIWSAAGPALSGVFEQAITRVTGF
jgi:hypothetical protein